MPKNLLLLHFRQRARSHS